MAILAPNLTLGLLEPSGNYNLAAELPFWLQIWSWFQSLLAITIWLPRKSSKAARVAQAQTPCKSSEAARVAQAKTPCKSSKAASVAQAQTTCKSSEAFWIRNCNFGFQTGPRAFGTSGNYSLAVKLPFWLQIWTRAFWSLLAITFWL